MATSTPSTPTSSIGSAPSTPGSSPNLNKRKLIDEFDVEFAPEHTSTPIEADTEVLGDFDEMEDDVPDSQLLEICENVSSHITIQEGRAQVRRVKPKFVSDKIDQLREQLAMIDHNKASADCTYYTCVYDTNEVERSLSDCNLSVNPNTTCPIDFTAPFGEAYYNANTGSPLVRLCNHNPCYPAQAQVFAAIKVFNMDGTLSQEPVVNEGFLPWFPNRNHHKKGIEAESKMKSTLNAEGEQEGLSSLEQSQFIDHLLMGTQKYPQGFFRNGNRISFQTLIQEGAIHTRVNEKVQATNTTPSNDEIVEFIIDACEEQLAEKFDYELMWNPLVDTQVDVTEVATNQRGLGANKSRYQSIDFFCTLMTNYNWFDALPAVFYRIPADDYQWYTRVQKNIKLGGTSISWVNEMAKHPTIGKFTPEEKTKSQVKVWFKNQNGMRQFHLIAYNAQDHHFIKFPENKVLHFIDSLLDLIFIYGKNIRSVVKELEYMMAERNYCNQLGFMPTRDEFGLGEDKFEILESGFRLDLLKSNLIKEFDLPTFQFSYLDQTYFSIKRGYQHHADTYNHKFPFIHLVTILKKMIKLAMYEKSMAHQNVASEFTNIYHYVKDRINDFVEVTNNRVVVKEEEANEVEQECVVNCKDDDQFSQENIKRQKIM